jgi:TonB family protein
LLPAPFLRLLFLNPSSGAGTVSIDRINVIPFLISDTAPALSLIGFIFIVWLLFTLSSLIIPIISTIRLRRRIARAQAVELDISCYDWNGQRIRVYQSDAVSMPLTLGIFRNSIFVPETWAKWPPECRQLILHHEWSHIRRRDGIIKTLQMIARAIYFFHPLVWILNWQIDEMREMACDDETVTSKKPKALEYPRYLVKIAEEIVHVPRGCGSASALIRQKNELLNRVKYQMREDRMKKTSKKMIAIVIAGLILLILPLSWYCSKEKPTEQTQDSSITTSADAESAAGEEPAFVPFDDPPLPIEGFGAIQSKLIYPEIARKAGIEGRVIVWVQIGEDGSVNRTKVKESLGPNGCDEAAMNAIKAVKWKPAEKDGKPLASWVAVPIDFRLSGASEKRIMKQTSSDLPKDLPEGVEFVPHDEPPAPIGGYKAIQTKLRYPEIARKAGIEGQVIIWAQIGEDGNVKQTTAWKSLGPNGCDEAAMNAIEAIKWKPAEKDGKPLACWIAVPVEFSLK